MAKNKKKEEEEIVDISQAEQFIENNFQKIILGLVGVFLIAAVFIWLSQSGNNKENKAEAAAAPAQAAFADDNWTLAIEGDDTTIGFQEIADSYAKTDIGNLAHYYMGISYMNMKKYQEAVDELKAYKPTNDPNVNGMAYKNLGDALSELGNMDEAMTYYKKAANTESEAFQADFLFQYGLAQVNQEDFDGARTTFTKLQQEFPKSAVATQAENYLAGL